MAAGAQVLLAARGGTEVAATAARLGAEGIVADLGSGDGCRALAAAVAERTDALDIVVHSAGATAIGSMEAQDEAEWDRIMALNVKAVHLLTGALAPPAHGPGHGGRPVAGDRHRLDVGAHHERAPRLRLRRVEGGRAPARPLPGRRPRPRRHVLVNAIAPGLFPTRMSAFLEHEAFREPVLSTLPLHRPGRPEEIAGTVVYLASRAGGYTTGEVLVVDGGRAAIGRADPIAGL